MPQRQPRTPAWLRDDDQRGEFLAVLAELDPTQPLPEVVERSATAAYPFAQRVRDVDAHEEALDESTWAELDSAGFPWRRPRAPRVFAAHPETAIVRKPSRTARTLDHHTLTELAKGHLSYSDVYALRTATGMRSDPVQVWLARGVRIMSAHHIPLLELCAQPDRTVVRDDSTFAIGAWLREVRAAVSDPALGDFIPMLRQHFSQVDYVALRNIGLIERYYATRPLVPLPTNYCVSLSDGSEVRVGRWIHYCRSMIRNGNAPAHLADALEHAGVILEPRPGMREWMLGIHALQQFHTREGNWAPSAKHIEVLADGSRIALRRFVNEILRDHAANALAPYQHRQLAALGFEFSDRSTILDRHFAERLLDLDAFIAERASTEIAAKDVYTRPDGTHIEVGRWIMHIRSMASKGTLADSRLQALEARGVRVMPLRRERHWETALVALEQYRSREGHVRVPPRWVETLPDGTTHPLGQWLAGKRYEHRRGRLADKYVQQLVAWGVDLDSFVDRAHSWQTHLRALEQFRNREGNANVVRTHAEVLSDGTRVEIGIWLRRQRELLRAGSLRPDRYAALDALGVEWEPTTAQFSTGFQMLKQFRAEHGHIDVPQRLSVPGPDGEPFPLGSWLAIRRRSMRHGTLAPEHETALRSLGVDPANRHDRHFEAGLAALRTFAEHHGHCAVHSRERVILADGTEFQLGSWVIHMRRMRRTERLSAQTIATLDAANFVWDDVTSRFAWNLAAYDRYRATGGQGRPPESYTDVLPDGSPARLRIWFDTQRRRLRAGTLPEDQHAALIERGVLPATATALSKDAATTQAARGCR